MGLLALILLVMLEFTVVLWVRGITLTAYFRERDALAGTIYYLLLVVYAVMPLMVARKPVTAGD